MSRDLIVSLCWLVFGLLVSFGSMNLGLGRISAPFAGLYPFLVGLAIIALSVIMCLTALLKREKEKQEAILGVKKKSLFVMIGCLLAYGLLLPLLGFPVITFLFMFSILKFIEAKKWSLALLVAVLTTIFNYLLFSLWLKVQFPTGIVG